MKEIDHTILESFLSSVSPVQQQIDSYNRFIHLGLQNIIKNQGEVQPNIANFAIRLDSIRLEFPKIIEADGSMRNILPHEAIMRNLTYAAPMFLTYTPIISDIAKEISTSEVYIGDLPVMVKSDLCYTKSLSEEQLISSGEDPADPGGYFIIKGTERVLIGIEDLATNTMTCTKEGSNTICKMFSTAQLGFRGKCSITRDNYGIYTIMFPTLSKGIDLILVLKALGLSEEEIINQVDEEEVKNDLRLSIDESVAKGMTTAEALDELGKTISPNQAKIYQSRRVDVSFDSYLLPHIGVAKEVRKSKAKLLVAMAERASLVAYGKVKQSDRDSYANKRVRLAGDLLEILFSNAFNAFVKDIRYHIEKTTARGKKISVRANINPESLTEKLLYAMGTGTWPSGQTGVSQVLRRESMFYTLSNLRTVKSPIAKKRTNLKAREVHGSHIGKICPSESPEGIEVGLTKYLALMAKITVGADEATLSKKINEISSKYAVE
ncbi:MAG: DNA-directed RNA polymerase subunit B'' [Candidatus Micrarchaeaceae archaeon]